MNKKLYFLILLFSFVLARSNANAFLIPEPLPGENQSIEVFGSTIKIKGLTDQSNTAWVNGRQIAVQKDGSFYEEVIVPTGQTEIILEVKDPDGNINRYSKPFKIEENYTFLAGIVDSSANFVTASQGFDIKRDNKNFDTGTHFSGKASYYFAGKIKGKYLIKSSLDTDKATQKKLFTNIDPDKYYPIYGDNSTVVYDTNSQEKFYLLIEWDKSGITVGNYQTDLNDESSKLASYNRTLYGGKIHLETPEKTVYGDTQSKATGFVATLNQFRGHSEFLATGGSLYYLRHRNIVEGSEQVRVDVRDKRTGLVIQSASQKENSDYEIKYDEGRILFKKPVLSVTSSDTVITDNIQEGNEVVIVANYEYTNQEAFPILDDQFNDTSGGFRLAHHLNDHLEIGGTYVQEQKDDRNHRLYGFDSTFKMGNFTKMNFEVVDSVADSSKSYISYNGGYDYTEVAVNNDAKSKATRLELNSSLGEYFGHGKEFFDLSAFYQALGKNFSPADSLFESGTNKYGMELAHRLTANDKLRLIYDNKEKDEGAVNQAALNQLTAHRVQNFTAAWMHLLKPFIFITEYRLQNKKNSLSAVDDPGKINDTDNIIAEKIQYDRTKDTSVFASQQIGLDDSTDSITSFGISDRFTPDLSANARVSLSPDRNSLLAGLEHQVDAKTSKYTNYQISNSAMDGKTSTTSFGSNTRISNTAELRREKNFVVSDERGHYIGDLIGVKNQLTPHLDIDMTYDKQETLPDDRLKGSTPRDAFSSTVAYANPDHFKGNSKFEYRVDTGDQWQVLSDSQGELKLTQDWFLFGECEYSRGKDITRDISISEIDKHQAGIAFRPVDFDWLNWLFKYTHLRDNRPRDLTSADGGFIKQKSVYDEYATELALDLPSVLKHFQFVEKVVYRNEDLIAVDINNLIETPQTIEAYLIIHRLNYHLTNKIDAAAEFRTLRQLGSDVNTLQYGPLVEFTYQIHKNIAIGAGYNFSSFKDDFTVLTKEKAEGFFVRLQGKY